MCSKKSELPAPYLICSFSAHLVNRSKSWLPIAPKPHAINDSGHCQQAKLNYDPDSQHVLTDIADCSALISIVNPSTAKFANQGDKGNIAHTERYRGRNPGGTGESEASHH